MVNDVYPDHTPQNAAADLSALFTQAYLSEYLWRNTVSKFDKVFPYILVLNFESTKLLMMMLCQAYNFVMHVGDLNQTDLTTRTCVCNQWL